MLIQFSIKIKKYLTKKMLPDTPMGRLSFRCKVFVFLCAVLLPVSGITFPDYARAQVNLYDVFETQVTNGKTYPNPFDFNVIELQATFTPPSGNAKTFFGFYDGDGVGGQTGNVWKLRFMPDEVGTWTYTYSWTDGTPGGTGSFNVVDSGLGGPLKIAADNSWYFQNARGNPFDWRGYDIRNLPVGQDHMDWGNTAPDNYIEVMQSHVLPRKYNFIMLQHPSWSTFPRSWWYNSQKDNFDLLVWKNFEKILRFCLANGVYVIPFDGMVSQDSSGHMSNVLARYFAARFGAFANYLGYSITWEYYDVFSETQIDGWMTFLKNSLPSGGTSLLTVHDKAKVGFTSWQDFHMQQGGDDGVTSSIFAANKRSYDVDNALLPYNKPIIGSEDIWEAPSGSFGYARNATEVRRTAWGEMMAGVMPLYSEWTWFIWNDDPAKLGNGEGEPEVRRMFDFFYSNTRYRQYQQLNGLVSSASRQIASGIPGQEYLVYDEDGGSVTIDLSGTPGTGTFSVIWFDPKSGASQNGGTITGGGIRSVSSPFSGDSVLLLGGVSPAPPDVTPPSAPTGVIVN